MKHFSGAMMLLVSMAHAGEAQSVSDCDWRASAQALAEPWEGNSRTFSNGQTRLALLDTIEPAAGALHLLVLSPPYGELGDRQCRVISYDGTSGFSGIEFDALAADYGPARGLIFTVPVHHADPASGDFQPAWLSFVLNQATGTIDVDLGGGD